MSVKSRYNLKSDIRCVLDLVSGLTQDSELVLLYNSSFFDTESELTI